MFNSRSSYLDLHFHWRTIDTIYFSNWIFYLLIRQCRVSLYNERCYHLYYHSQTLMCAGSVTYLCKTVQIPSLNILNLCLKYYFDMSISFSLISQKTLAINCICKITALLSTMFRLSEKSTFFSKLWVIWHSSLLILSIPDEGCSRNVSCALIILSMFFVYSHQYIMCF